MRKPMETAAARGRTKRWLPPGGKALARLGLFAEARGLPSLVAPGEATSISSSERARLRRARTEASSVIRAYLNAAKALAAVPPGAPPPSWHSLGPTSIPNGQTYGSSRVTVSGRVAAGVRSRGPRNRPGG